MGKKATPKEYDKNTKKTPKINMNKRQAEDLSRRILETKNR